MQIYHTKQIGVIPWKIKTETVHFCITYFICLLQQTVSICKYVDYIVKIRNLYVSDNWLNLLNLIKSKEMLSVNSHSHINVGFILIFNMILSDLILKINTIHQNAQEIFLLNSWRTFWLARVMVSNCPFFLKCPQQFWERKKNPVNLIK